MGVSFSYGWNVCTISKVIGINKEKHMWLPNNLYISAYRWERINMVSKYLMHMHITAELKATSFIFKIFTFWGCGGPKRTDFNNCHFGGGVAFKGLMSDNFHFGRMWWYCNNWFWTISTLIGSVDIKRIALQWFLPWDNVVFLKRLIFNYFHFWKMCHSWKDWFCVHFTLGWCGVMRGLI